MSGRTDPPYDDEIDLVELIESLWQEKVLIITVAAVCLALASAYLHIAERTYTVTLSAQPAQSEDASPSLGGFAGLASLAGVSLPSGSGGDFNAMPLMMTAPEVTEVLARDLSILRYFFENEWDEATEGWREPSRGAISSIVGQLKLALTGEGAAPYRAPDAYRLAEKLKEVLSASLDAKSGRLNLTLTTPVPDFGADLIVKVFATADEHFRRKFMTSGESSIEFYQTQLARARAAEHREALAKVIASEQQKLMLATRSEFFVANILTGPTASIGPTAPRGSLVLALGLVLGLISGAAIVLIRKAFKREAR